jgi:SAM-dependent methyltransferase
MIVRMTRAIWRRTEARITRMAKRASIAVAPLWTKQREEMTHWTRRQQAEGTLRNDHYEPFYTTHFGLARQDYAGKRILDIGCGPRGSLEWADGALERVGLDPLANEYARQGFTAGHSMKYVDCFSESMPFPDAHFDIVCSFNSLDHVEDVGQTIAQIKRVTRPGGLFLLIVEVGHEPTATEPHDLPLDLAKRFEPEFAVEQLRHYERPRQNGMYDTIAADLRYDWANPMPRAAILIARFRRL